MTAEAPQYAEHFAGEAARALQHVAAAGGGAESAETLRAASGLVEMAECIREGSAARAGRRSTTTAWRWTTWAARAWRWRWRARRGLAVGFLSHSPSGAPPPSSLRRTRFAPVVADSADSCAIAGRARGVGRVLKTSLERRDALRVVLAPVASGAPGCCSSPPAAS